MGIFLHKRACTGKDIYISNMEELIPKYKSDFLCIQYHLVDFKELERCAVGLERRAVNSDSMIPLSK